MRIKHVIILSIAIALAAIGVALSRGFTGPEPAIAPHGAGSHNHGEAATPPASPGHSHSAAHMKMTRPRKARAGDRERADRIVKTARRSVEKYRDYRVALEEGYQILLPNVPQSMYHFNNFSHAMEAERRFDPSRPTSLLYEREGDGYRLIGLMYTAPAGMAEDALDKRIPLSVASWHQHVNICIPPGTPDERLFSADSRFGLNGSITTRQECEEAGGAFYPRLFGWMVHLYPFEESESDIWSVERQITSGPAPH
jgi:hypothetical protein